MIRQVRNDPQRRRRTWAVIHNGEGEGEGEGEGDAVAADRCTCQVFQDGALRLRRGPADAPNVLASKNCLCASS